MMLVLQNYYIGGWAGGRVCPPPKLLSGLALDLFLAGLLGEEDLVDVGHHTARGDGHAGEQLGELLVVADGELDVAGHNAALLVVAGGVAGELEDLSGEVLKDGREAHGELEPGLGGPRGPLPGALALTLAAARHG